MSTIPGPVRVAWKMVGAKRYLDIELPKGVRACVQPQPDGNWVEVGEG
jgi:hypothetical protein